MNPALHLQRTAALDAGAPADAASPDRLCLDGLARFKRPKAGRLVASLPENSDGKALRTALRQQWAAA